MLCCWIEDPNSEAFKLHLPRIYDYLWVAEDGIKMQGYNVSQLWDTAFAVQAILSTNLAEECYTTLKKAHSFINKSQVLDDCPVDLSYWYRHISEGVWPFSTADHGWPISDCTPEGLKAALLLSKLPSEMVGEPIEAKRLYAIVNVILSLQPSSCSTSDHQNKNVKPMRILLSRVANHVSHDKEVVKELQRMATRLKALPTSRSRIVTGFGYSYLWEVRVGEPWHRQV